MSSWSVTLRASTNRLALIGADPKTISSLTERGREQAEELGRILDPEPID